MFKIHKKVEYSLIALKYMRVKPRKDLTTAKEICGRFDIPFDPTSRVLQIMTQHGILEAEQGAYGGYRLVGDLARLSIFDLSQMIGGPLALANCCAKEAECERLPNCVLKDPMTKLNVKLLKVFKDMKVSEMI